MFKSGDRYEWNPLQEDTSSFVRDLWEKRRGKKVTIMQDLEFKDCKYSSLVVQFDGEEETSRVIPSSLRSTLCDVCGKVVDSNFGPYKTGEYLQVLCHSCNFWYEQLRDPGLVIGGKHFRIGTNTAMLGCSGRHFRIKKGNEIIETNNLWFQGDIPKEFRPMFPDNAIFLEPIKKNSPNN